VNDAQLALDALLDPELAPSEWEFARATILVAKYAKVNIATAESLTGGFLSSLLTSVPGSSQVFQGGVVAYATEIKKSVLEIPQKVLDHGVVSTEVALAMATNVTKLMNARFGLGCTGVAGPDTQDGRPVGEVHIAIFDSATGSSRTQTLMFTGTRDDIRSQTSLALLGLCLDVLVGLTDLSRTHPSNESKSE
jgi:nicotinamide-nucleotide amidase